MLYYLILCRSLTKAQRTAAALERAGIFTRTIRSPKHISGEGCSHCVRISRKSLERSLAVLQQTDLEPKRVFAVQDDGGFTEIQL